MEQELKGFTKSLFAGNIPEEMVFPYPKVPEAENELLKLSVDQLRKFGKEQVDSVKIEEQKALGSDLIRGLGEMGIFGLIIPEKFGGLGMSQMSYGRMFEELGYLDASIAVTIGAHSSIGLKGLLLFGNDEQKERYLPKLATGEMIAAFALTEPGSGSDAYSIQTRAQKNADGSYTLTGNKIWITNGGIADFFTVFAKTEVEEAGVKKDKITAFIVERSFAGFSSGKEEKKLGIKGSSTTEIHLNQVRVPKENILGEVGKGFKIAMEILNSGRLGLGTGSVGGAKHLLALASEHASQRKQFGRPIAEFGLIKEKLGQMATDIYASECASYLTCGLVDQKNVDYSLESAICKVNASEMLWRAANEATQIAGGSSYMQEYPYERMLRDARINMIFEGTNEILRCFIALSGIKGVGDYLKIVGEALNAPIKSLGVLVDYFLTQKISKSLYGDKISKAHMELKKETSQVEDLVEEFSAGVEKVVRRHHRNLPNMQLAQKRIAEVAMDLYVMISVISRTSQLIAKDPQSAQTELTLAKIFCAQAFYRCRTNMNAMDRNLDDYIKSVAEQTTQARMFPSFKGEL